MFSASTIVGYGQHTDQLICHTQHMGANESRLNSDDLGMCPTFLTHCRSKTRIPCYSCCTEKSRPICRLVSLTLQLTDYSEPFFDFCVGINGQPLADLGVNILNKNISNAQPTKASWSMVEESEGRTIIINTWNSKHQEYRGKIVRTYAQT